MDLDKLHLKKTGKKSDGKRFGFIKVFTKRIDKLLQNVNVLVDEVNESKPYEIDFNVVEREYLNLGVGDIDEFSNNHAFSLSLLQGFSHDKEAQHACYETIRHYLWEKKKNGEIS
ncbi:MAG: hypothetical protein CMH48_07855 [Muricauda sp.]|nr:hypothetical protein [Allomuricauda sp.]MBC30747.1 hypothetical protein [Allomuricauda sp.]|tara:strand:+ start:54055 stop:54399 length:345 start_codon:yes stop_codon:yes gene_type:complete